MRDPWHYLILTAANQAQAAAFESQIRPRLGRGPLARVAKVLVVPDLEGRRVGSGGSTIQCLLEVLNHCGAARTFQAAEGVLRELRILIVHAGGDSRRLPAYSSCGKIFVPLPGDSTLFDRLISTLLDLPPNPGGQLVVAAGDALIQFDPAGVDLSRPGLTALAGRANAEEAARHGVFCADASGGVRLYLQKPTVNVQATAGALDVNGRSLLDLGIMSFSAGASLTLLRTFCRENGGLAFRPRVRELVLRRGLDLYREICCALGSCATLGHYAAMARKSGSTWPEKALAGVFPLLHEIPLQAAVLNRHRFLHFGSTQQLIESGLELAEQDSGARPGDGLLLIQTAIEPGGSVSGRDAWVEGCRVRAPLSLAGRNVVSGVELSEPLDLPCGACLDICRGRSRRGESAWFIRCYSVEDSFKHGAAFNGMPLAEWLDGAGVRAADVWEKGLPESERTLWNARVFPAESQPGAFTRWLWMHDPRKAGATEKRAFLDADRYSAAEVALAADLEHHYEMRESLRAAVRQAVLPKEREKSL